MIQTYVYCTLLLCLFLYLWVKKYNKMGLILMALYSSVGIMAVNALQQGMFDSKDITLLPYLFLLIIYIIAFWPFLSRSTDLNIKKLDFRINKKYLIFAYVFIVMSLISISYYLPLVKKLLLSGEWSANRNNLYSGTLTYNTAMYEYISLQFTGYTRLLGILVGFALLRENEKTLIGWSCIIVSIVTEILSAMYTSSRGSILSIALLVTVVYMFFYDDLEKNKRRFVIILSSLSLVVIIPYVIEVTVSRFSSGGASNSLIEYLGQAPIVFNYGVFTMNKHLYGEWAVGKLFGGRTISPSELGGSWGSGFYTFVGWLFIDWGIFGTIIVVTLISLLTNHLIKKQSYSIADLYLIFFVYYTLLSGVFVIGRSYIYNIIAALLIYCFIKIFFDRYTIIVGRMRL